MTRLRLVETNDNPWVSPESYEPDPDEQMARAVRDEISDGLIWLGAGAVCGALFTVGVAWMLSTWVL